jgi:hypothetical protein
MVLRRSRRRSITPATFGNGHQPLSFAPECLPTSCRAEILNQGKNRETTKYLEGLFKGIVFRSEITCAFGTTAKK